MFSLSLRDVELILSERGVIVSYETVRRWCKKFGANFADPATPPATVSDVVLDIIVQARRYAVAQRQLLPARGIDEANI